MEAVGLDLDLGLALFFTTLALGLFISGGFRVQIHVK